ncbi:MAG: CotH kinase family protein [Pseudomonadota bacterium]|nr:CotH kinase family protein [Pseudomonadota bacterium]
MLLLLACVGPKVPPLPDAVDTGYAASVVEGVGDAPPRPCPAPDDLYTDDCVVRYDLELAEEDLATMRATYDAAVASCATVATEVLRAVHPATLRYGDQTLAVGLRLKGNPCTFLAGGKMQFRVDLDHVDPTSEFHGVTSLNLESANYDPTLVKNGLALAVFRDVDGLVAPDANHAAVYINGAFYGVFENVEQINGTFLENHFDEPDGNLYWFIWNGHFGSLETNTDIGDTSDWDAMEALVNATPGTVSSEEFGPRFRELVDVDQLLLVFAAEAVVPQTDGVWAGSANCYLYNEPGRGFVYLPWDLDSAFTQPPAELCPACGTLPDTVDADPITFITGRGPAAKWRAWDLLMAIPEERARYLVALRRVLDEAFDPATLVARHEATLARIEPYVQDDPFVDRALYDAENAELLAFYEERRAFMEGWLEAER